MCQAENKREGCHLHIGAGYDVALHPTSAGEKCGFTAAKRIRAQGADGAAQDAELGPPGGGAVLVSMAVIEGI